jgi:alanyl-tRNA synthetase
MWYIETLLIVLSVLVLGNHFTSPIRILQLRLHMSSFPSLNVCQIDAYKRESLSRVISQVQNADSTFSVTLEDCIFYPEGGGQPRDYGFVDGVPILDVAKSNEDGKYLAVKLPSPLEREKKEVNCVVDWSRRYDFMQQHTAQHLLSAVADRMYSADTVAWALGCDSVTVDLLPPSGRLSTDQVQDLEDEVNRQIRENLSITWKVYKKDELTSLSGLRGAPKGAALDLSELRIIEIGGLDKNPCGGTHVRSLCELQLLKVLSTEKMHGGSRIKFVAGDRALRYFSSAVDKEASFNSLLSAPPDMVKYISSKSSSTK